MLFSAHVIIIIRQQNGDLKASVKTTNLSAGKDVKLFVGELNGSQNYLQFLIDGVDKGYIVFDVSRNINT